LQSPILKLLHIYIMANVNKQVFSIEDMRNLWLHCDYQRITPPLRTFEEYITKLMERDIHLIYIVRTNANTWGKSPDLFEAMKYAGCCQQPFNREMQINLCITGKPEEVTISEIDGTLTYSKDSVLILLKDNPMEVKTLISDREVSQYVCSLLDKMGKDKLAQALDDLEYDFKD